LSDVLKDSDAYILFYARDDPHESNGKAKSNGLHSSPSITKPNGVSLNGSSGKKRPIDEETRNERSKRQRQSEDEDDDLEITPSSPLVPNKSQTSVNIQAKTSTTQRTYGKPQLPNSGTSHNRLMSQNAIRKKYSPKSFPPPSKSLQSSSQVARSTENSFFQQVHKHDIPSKPQPLTSNSQPLIKKQNSHRQHHQRSPGQLHTTNINPYVVDEDKEPFVYGFDKGAQHRSHIKYPGLPSQLRPGATTMFMQDPMSKSGMLTTSGNGIKLKRKDRMR
jgi:hypothetical protein